MKQNVRKTLLALELSQSSSFRYANSKFTHKSGVSPLIDANGNTTIDPEFEASLL